MKNFRSLYWFVVINSLLAMVISTRYFNYIPELPTDIIGLSFVIISVISQMFLLTALVGLLCLPIIFLPTQILKGASALMAALGLSLLVIDTFVFAQYRFHINGIVLDLVFSGDVVSFPISSWVMVIVGAGFLLSVEYLIFSWLVIKQELIRKWPAGKTFLIVFSCLLVSHGVHIWAAANAYQPVKVVKRYLPLFYPSTANRFMEKNGWINEVEIAREKKMRVTVKADINYPLNVLSRYKPLEQKNIVLVVIDSWRFDSFNEENTPNIWNFTQQGLRFENHLSTGNATRTGIFGLFYGIHGTYWHTFLANQQSPVLMQRLQDLNYQLGIFASADLRSPEFNQTVFKDVENLRLRSSGASASERDMSLTNDWLLWNVKRDKSQPSFSFLFYDAPHAYDFPQAYAKPYLPMARSVNYLALNNEYDAKLLFNRYKNSVHYVDSLVGKVIESIRDSGEIDNTVVIITGDHGQEMNDNKLNFWGHNSNFTDSQIKVPFAIVDGSNVNLPKNGYQSMMTSHLDFVPTMMHNYLGITNDVKHYSTGVDLYASPVKRPWLLSSNYSGYALIDQEKIVEVRATGEYQVLDKSNRQNSKLSINFNYVQQALTQMSVFNR